MFCGSVLHQRSLLMNVVLVTVLVISAIKYLAGSNLKGEGYTLKEQPSMEVMATGDSGSHGIYSQEEERDECWHSTYFLLFIQYRIPVHRVEPQQWNLCGGGGGAQGRSHRGGFNSQHPCGNSKLSVTLVLRIQHLLTDVHAHNTPMYIKQNEWKIWMNE